MRSVIRTILCLAVAGACACHARHDAAPSEAASADPAASSSSRDLAAAAGPSETASAAPAQSASAAPSASTSTANAEASREMQQFGVIGVLGDPKEGKPVGDAGAMFGDEIGDSFGYGGLGLTGLGKDGVGDGGGLGLGLGTIGTMGHGAGTGSGTGYGSGSGRIGPPHPSSARVRQGAVTVSGRLPPEVVQRIARRSFARFRFCYEQGLQRDPKLAGTVAVKFVIDAKGAVSSASRDPSTTLSDGDVVSCVTRNFERLTFPQPEAGAVSVVFPLVFSSGDAP